MEFIGEEDDVEGVVDCEKERGCGGADTFESSEFLNGAMDVVFVGGVVVEGVLESSGDFFVCVRADLLGEAGTECTMAAVGMLICA